MPKKSLKSTTDVIPGNEIINADALKKDLYKDELARLVKKHEKLKKYIESADDIVEKKKIELTKTERKINSLKVFEQVFN